MQHSHITSCEKKLQYKACITIIKASILAWSVMERADDGVCRGMQIHTQAGRGAYRSPRTKDVIGRTFYSPMPSTDDINTFRTLSDCDRDVNRFSTSITKMFFNQTTYFMNKEIRHKINYILNDTKTTSRWRHVIE